jgi:hypothetical protein
MNISTLLILGVILVVLVVGVFFGILFLTLFIYVVSHLYPWLRKIGVWAARPENLLSLIIVALLLIIVIIFASVLLHITLLLLLLVFPILTKLLANLGMPSAEIDQLVAEKIIY